MIVSDKWERATCWLCKSPSEQREIRRPNGELSWEYRPLLSDAAKLAALETWARETIAGISQAVNDVIRDAEYRLLAILGDEGRTDATKP